MMSRLNQKLLKISSQFKSTELGQEFAKRPCNMICSQIIPVINDNPEEAIMLLGCTDKSFVAGIVKLLSDSK